MDRNVWRLLDEFVEAELRNGLQAASVAVKRRALEKFFVYLEERHPGCTCRTVTSAQVREYLAHSEDMTGKRLSGRSYNRQVGYFNDFYRFCLQHDEVFMNPAAKIDYVPVSRGEHFGIFSEQEVKAIFETLEDTYRGRRDRAILELLYSTGLRARELTGLDLEDLDLECREVMVRQGKGGGQRMAPVGEQACAAVARYVQERYRWFVPGGERHALFLSGAGRRLTGKRLGEIIRKRKAQAGVTSKGVTHAFRYSCATHLLARGAPITAIQRLLGHAHLYTTQEYVRVCEKELQRVHRASHPKAKKEENDGEGCI